MEVRAAKHILWTGVPHFLGWAAELLEVYAARLLLAAGGPSFLESAFGMDIAVDSGPSALPSTGRSSSASSGTGR